MGDMIKRQTRGIMRRVGLPFLILFILIIIPQTTLLAQAPDTLWTKTYGGKDHNDAGYSVQ